MKRATCLAVALCSLLLPQAWVAAQKKLADRIVAAVDGRVITLDEWQQRERFDALMQGRHPAEIQPSEASLNRLIDSAVIDKNVASVPFSPVTAEEVNQQLNAVRKQLNGATTDDEWRSLLLSYGLNENEVRAQLSAQLNVLRFIDARFRPGARITPEQVSSYYRETFVPNFQKETPGSHPPALVDVTDQITRILTEKLMDQRFTTWLQNLRTQAKVQRIGASVQTSESAPAPAPH